MKFDQTAGRKEPVSLGPASFARLNDLHVYRSGHNPLGREFYITNSVLLQNSSEVCNGNSHCVVIGPYKTK